MPKVQKQDGSVTDFDSKKMLLSLVRAGVAPDQAERILDNIRSWFYSLDMEFVKSSDIRQRIVDLLKKINPQAARGYKMFRKSQALK